MTGSVVKPFDTADTRPLYEIQNEYYEREAVSTKYNKKYLQMWHCYTTDTVFVRVTLLLTDQTPDSGNPLLICCHGAVLLMRFNKNTNTVEKRERDKRNSQMKQRAVNSSTLVYTY